ncbi:hypothetical protein BD779DRAFT_118400 [Infundibulicybe gibba]|nr:hypothetical protein BD779DRAFT_118400 [Infundibulicybe gibba]
MQELPRADAEQKRCETILQQLEPQLVEFSERIFDIVRFLGARTVAFYDLGPLSVEEADLLISLSLNGEPDILQQTLGLSHRDLTADPQQRTTHQIYKGLYRWLLARHQPNKWRPTSAAARRYTCATVNQYTWAWAWDTYASQYPPSRSGVDFVHYVDLIYGCLRLILLEFGQPLCAPPIVSPSVYPC